MRLADRPRHDKRKEETSRGPAQLLFTHKGRPSGPNNNNPFHADGITSENVVVSKKK